MKIAVVGAGHVGLVTGLVLWESGHDVVLIDSDRARVDSLARGLAPFFEPELAALLDRAISAGNLAVTAISNAALGCDVALLCVPTPSRDDGAIDTRALSKAVSEIAEAIDACGHAEALRAVFVRSTVIPGTTRRIVIESLGHLVDVGVLPEFLREGSALADARSPDRVVVGADRAHVFELARALYPSAPSFVEMRIESAELVKYASNSLLALCVSFSNELARIAEHLPGVDARDVLSAVALDRRFSLGEERAGITSYLEPGPGFGGSCLTKDVRALAALARSENEAATLLDGIVSINASQPIRLVERIAKTLGGLDARDVLVLGLAFKPDTDDVRESIAVPIVEELERRGARVTCHDPIATSAFFATREGAATASSDWRVTAHSVDAIVLLVGWVDYLAALPEILAKRSSPVLFADTRGLLRSLAASPLVRYLGVGRGGDSARAET